MAFNLYSKYMNRRNLIFSRILLPKRISVRCFCSSALPNINLDENATSKRITSGTEWEIWLKWKTPALLTTRPFLYSSLDWPWAHPQILTLPMIRAYILWWSYQKFPNKNHWSWACPAQSKSQKCGKSNLGGFEQKYFSIFQHICQKVPLWAINFRIASNAEY